MGMMEEYMMECSILENCVFCDFNDNKLTFFYIDNHKKYDLIVLGNPTCTALYMEDNGTGLEIVHSFENIEEVKTPAEFQSLFEFETSSVKFLDHIPTIQYDNCRIHWLDPEKRYFVLCRWSGEILSLAPEI